jgi:uncharacterized repeat protein (TIGR04042 family)
MPEMRFLIRWPDGTQETCYSPSLVVKDYFEPGKSHDIDDFLARSRTALEIASERVRAKYGHPCSFAAAQLARTENAVAAFSARPNACVMVESFEQ